MLPRGGSMRKWRNWQTRTFEGRVDFTVRVQVPFSAPRIGRARLSLFFTFKEGFYDKFIDKAFC